VATGTVEERKQKGDFEEVRVHRNNASLMHVPTPSLAALDPSKARISRIAKRIKKRNVSFEQNIRADQESNNHTD